MYRRSPDFQETMDGIDPLRGTYHSADSNSSPLRASASSSKAVLAALRALQDKIKRLESERTQALDETANLRQQIKNQEMEADNFKRRDSLASQKKLHEVQSAYDRSVTEKTESEIRLSNLEERNRIEDEIARDLRAKIRAVEDEKHNGLLVIKDMESERTRLQSQILHVQHKEKDLGETIIWETKKHEEDMDVLSAKLRFQQNDLSTLVHEKSIVETKLLELDQLVGQLLLVNESLVIRLSGKPIPKNSSLASTKKKKNVPQQLPRAAYTSTFSQLASNGVTANSNITPGNSHEEKSSVVAAAQDAEHLHNIHRMYVDLARNITEKHNEMSENENFDTNGKGSRSGFQSAYEPGSGSGSHISQRKKEINRSGQSPNKVNPSVSFYNNDDYNNMNKNDIDINYNYGDENLKEKEERHNYDDSFHGNYSASFIGGSGNTPNRPSGLQGVISTLEEEFITLNDQYRYLLSTIKAQSPSQEIEKEEELVSIIQKLHKKGEQLRSLKSPTK